MACDDTSCLLRVMPQSCFAVVRLWRLLVHAVLPFVHRGRVELGVPRHHRVRVVRVCCHGGFRQAGRHGSARDGWLHGRTEAAGGGCESAADRPAHRRVRDFLRWRLRFALHGRSVVALFQLFVAVMMEALRVRW